MLQVILPTDFSDNAWKAMSYAANIYHNQPCKFFLVHTYTMPYSHIETGVIQDMTPMIEEAEKEMKKILARYLDLDHHPESKFDSLAKFGSLADTLDQVKEDYTGDSIIVMGTKGASGAGKFFLGSMTTTIIDSLKKTPIICVPYLAELSPLNKIMLAVDKNGITKSTTLSSLVNLATHNEAGIKVVHMPEEKETVLAAGSAEQLTIHSFLGNLTHTFHTFGSHYDEHELVNYAIADEANLMAFIKHDRGFWKNLFHKSLTTSLAFDCKLPLLILRD
ncbi:MAG: universal stress protein [Crocinitomix sp.]|nr:universal stress protein [Crocinitomix sp.]